MIFVSPWIQWHKVTATGPQERMFSSQNHTARAHSNISPPSQPGTCAPSAHGPHCTSSSISHVLFHPYKRQSSCFFQDWLSSSSWQKQLKETSKCSSPPIVPVVKQASKTCQSLQQPHFIFETAFSRSRKCLSRWPGELQVRAPQTPVILWFWENQQNPISLPHTQVSMESYSYWHESSSGIFSPNAVRWLVGWLLQGEETSHLCHKWI